MSPISAISSFLNNSTPQLKQKSNIYPNQLIKLHSQPKADSINFGMSTGEIKAVDSKLEIVQAFIRGRLQAFKNVELVRSSDPTQTDIFVSKQAFKLSHLQELAELAEKKIDANLAVIKTLKNEHDIPECVNRAYQFKEKSRAADYVKNNFLVIYPEKIGQEFEFSPELNDAQIEYFLSKGKAPFVVSTNAANTKYSPDVVKKNIFSNKMQELIENKLIRTRGEFTVQAPNNQKLKFSRVVGSPDLYSIKVVE